MIEARPSKVSSVIAGQRGGERECRRSIESLSGQSGAGLSENIRRTVTKVECCHALNEGYHSYSHDCIMAVFFVANVLGGKYMKSKNILTVGVVAVVLIMASVVSFSGMETTATF